MTEASGGSSRLADFVVVQKSFRKGVSEDGSLPWPQGLRGKSGGECLRQGDTRQQGGIQGGRFWERKGLR